jgi:hypothetical protein
MGDSPLRSKLLKRFGAFCRTDLAPLGFQRKGFHARRDLEDLRQGVSVQLDRRGAERYTINVFWHLLVTPHRDPSDWMSMDGSWRIGPLAGEQDRWFTTFQAATFESQFAEAAQLVVEYALPLLKRYDSVRAIVAGVDAGELTRIKAFGPDKGWQRSKLAYCVAYLGDYERAQRELTELFEQSTAEARYHGKDLLEQLQRGERPRIQPAVAPEPARRPPKAQPVAPSRRVIVRKGPRAPDS